MHMAEMPSTFYQMLQDKYQPVVLFYSLMQGQNPSMSCNPRRQIRFTCTFDFLHYIFKIIIIILEATHYKGIIHVTVPAQNMKIFMDLKFRH